MTELETYVEVELSPWGHISDPGLLTWKPKGTPWVVATGTLTNIALLFATFPEVAEHIQGLKPERDDRIGNVRRS
jgi:hypothetical protein